MDYKKEEFIFYKHLTESADSAYYNENRIYTDFLTLNEISIFHASLYDLPEIPYSFWGGIRDAERVRACFHGGMTGGRMELMDTAKIKPECYPIACVYIQPSDYKFAGQLTHRDYLGAVLNLGLERSKIGDIVLQEKDAYLFCDSAIGNYVAEELHKISHTTVKTSFLSYDDMKERGFTEKQYDTIYGSVSSVRLDSVIKTAFHISRNGILPYISSGKVFVNGKTALSNSYPVKEEDVISVRGLGKFRYEGQCGISKKGKMNIKILKYI